MKYEGEFKIILGSVAFAFIPVFVLWGNELGVQSLLLGRLFFASLFLYFLLENKKAIFKLTGKEIVYFTIWSLLMLGSMGMYFLAINQVGIAISAALLGTQPLFIVLLAFLFMKERISFSTLIACICSLLGIFMITGLNDVFDSAYLVGELLAIGSALLISLNFIYKKMYLNKYSGKQLVFYQSVFQIPFILPFLFFNPGIITFASGTSAILLGLICTVFAYVLIYDGIAKVKAQKIGILQSVEYIMPVFIGILFYHEKIDPVTGTGIGLILLGCFLVTLKK